MYQLTGPIGKFLEFDAGHRVYGHESKCAHLHGHRYKAEIVVQGRKLDTVGRVIDFGVVKEVIGSWIDTYWDHNLLLHPDDPILKARDFVEGLGQPFTATVFAGKAPFVMPEGQNPTAENMAAFLHGVCVRELPKLHITRVVLWETPTCYAVWPPPSRD